MSSRINNYALDDKITSIRDTLQRLTADYQNEPDSPFQEYMKEKYFPSFEVGQGFPAEESTLHKLGANILKNSYSVDDIKSVEDLGGTIVSGQFEIRDSPIKTCSTYNIIDPSESTGFILPAEKDALIKALEKELDLIRTQSAEEIALKDKEIQNLSEVNSELVTVNQELTRKIQEIEDQVHKLEHSQNYSKLTQEVLSLKAEKVQLLKTIDQMQQDSVINIELSKDKVLLENQVRDLKNLLKNASGANKENDISYEQEIQMLKLENSRLKNKAKKPRRKTISSNGSCSNTPRPKSAVRDGTGIVSNVLHELGLNSSHLIIGTIKTMKKDTKSIGSYKTFVEKIKELIIECSPPNSFKKNLTLKRIWKWIKRLIEEYLQYKIKFEQISAQDQVVEKLKAALKVKGVEGIPKAVCGSLAENERMLVMLSKVKCILGMPEHSTLNTIEELINQRLKA